MTSLPFKFPVLRIPPPDGGDEWEDTVAVDTEPNHFTVGRKKEIQKQMWVGHIIMDCKGRSWRLTKLLDLGFQEKSFWSRMNARLLGAHDIRYELSEELKLPLSDIKERVRATVLANPDAHKGEAALENGPHPSKSDQELLEAYLAKISAANSPLELIAVVDFHEYVEE